MVVVFDFLEFEVDKVVRVERTLLLLWQGLGGRVDIPVPAQTGYTRAEEEVGEVRRFFGGSWGRRRISACAGQLHEMNVSHVRRRRGNEGTNERDAATLRNDMPVKG